MLPRRMWDVLRVTGPLRLPLRYISSEKNGFSAVADLHEKITVVSLGVSCKISDFHEFFLE